MTFEEALLAATRLLDQRGQLLNAHLFRVVEGDKELFREVREQLVLRGMAEDRSGVGLVRAGTSTAAAGENVTESSRDSMDGSATSTSTSEPSYNDLLDAALAAEDSVLTLDWWLMTSGVIRGPMDLITLCQMRQRGEFLLADVVRQGTQGLWRHPDEIPLLAASKAIQVAPKKMTERPTQRDKFVPTEKTWLIDKRTRPSSLRYAWNVSAGIVGGSRRLKGLLVSFVVIGLFICWWQQPPTASTIYNEFTSCRTTFKRLQDRHIKRSEWEETATGYRPRIKYILDRLKPRASEKYPLENALYSAGTYGVLELLDNPGSINDREAVFEKNMKIARKLLDGQTP